MLDVEINLKDIRISSVEEKDLIGIQKWMETNNAFLKEESALEELKNRFLESYISECEFFFKIEKSEKLVGILKGRVEFKKQNELWIWFFYLDNICNSEDLRSVVIKYLMNYFNKIYGVNIFFARVIKDEADNVNFWKDIGFSLARMVKNFYNVNGKYIDMMLMKKIGVSQ
ncbi:GNAT family N-acetyltransferase [Clostridium sp. BJN0013]|uniref:GNAT family N-acetyltransferase n=1 Tax=Clostridium sp. BJN0013 TaxID=3236840 RepID=UPI0034C65158